MVSESEKLRVIGRRGLGKGVAVIESRTCTGTVIEKYLKRRTLIYLLVKCIILLMYSCIQIINQIHT